MNKSVGAGDGSVAVLLPVYNAELYLREAIQSIISQTFGNYRLIVVDDASSDSSWSIIEGFNDRRIVKIRLPQSKGIVNALNIALELADSEFIARMDADDIARNDRFEKQLDFLTSHPEVGVCGSSIKMIKGGLSCYVRYPESHDEILCSLAIYKRSVCHPTVMMRRSVLNRHKTKYTEEYRHAEDLFLWHRLVQETRFHNLQEPLLTYRVHTGQVSSRYKKEQVSQTRALLNRTLPNSLPSLSSRTREELLNLLTPEPSQTGYGIDQIDLPSLYARLEATNRADRFSAPAVFNRILLCKFLEVVFKRSLGLRNTVFVVLTVCRENPGLLLNDVNRFFLHIGYYLRVNWVK